MSSPGVCAINGLLYVIGGDDGSCNLSSVEYYDPATDKWSLIPTNMSNGRSYAGMHYFLIYFLVQLYASDFKINHNHMMLFTPFSGVSVIDKQL